MPRVGADFEVERRGGGGGGGARAERGRIGREAGTAVGRAVAGGTGAPPPSRNLTPEKTPRESIKDDMVASSKKIHEEMQKGARMIGERSTAYEAKMNKMASDPYEGIAARYRKAFEDSEKLAEIEKKNAQRDWQANAAMMSKAAAVGMEGKGPMLGAQQAMMMGVAQQQATSAYSAAQDRIASMDMQRKQLGAQVTQSAIGQEMQALTQGYQAGVAGIEAVTQGNMYAGQAELQIQKTMMDYDTSWAQLQIAANAPQAQGPSTMSTMFSRGLGGAATGFMIGGPVGAAVGGGIGVLSSLFG